MFRIPMLSLIMSATFVLSLAGIASAKNAFNISGEWHANRGPTVNIPASADLVCSATPGHPAGPGARQAQPAAWHGVSPPRPRSRQSLVAKSGKECCKVG